MKPFTMDEFLAHMDPNVNKTFTDMGIQVPDISAQPPIQNSMPQSQPMPKPALAPSEPQASSVQDPLVREHLMKKMYDMGEFTDENRQSLVDQNSGFSLGDKISGALSALGAGFQGRDSGAAMNARMNQIRGQKDAAINQFDKARDQKIQNNKISQDNEKFDPMSSSSMAFKKAIESNFPEIAKAYGEAWKDVSAADQELIFEPLKLKETIEGRKQAAWLANEGRKDLLEMKSEEKKLASDEKKKTALLEVQDRTDNINAAIDTLDKMIENDGTWEATGSHNQDIDRLVDQIATDSAKLMDPNSVARPGEVELVKQGLVQSGFKNSNETARKILQNYKQEVSRRAQNAYKIRGIETPESIKGALPPSGQGTQEVERKTKDGKTAVFDATTKQFLRYK